MDFYCAASTPTPILFIRGSDGQALFYATGSNVSGSYNSWRGRQIIPAGDSFQISVSSGTWDITISGYHLTLP